MRKTFEYAYPWADHRALADGERTLMMMMMMMMMMMVIVMMMMMMMMNVNLFARGEAWVRPFLTLPGNVGRSYYHEHPLPTAGGGKFNNLIQLRNIYLSLDTI